MCVCCPIIKFKFHYQSSVLSKISPSLKGLETALLFPYPLPLENMLLPNSFTHASYTHQLYNCSGNERAKAANWYGNNISSPATLAALSNHHCSVYESTYATHTHKCGKNPRQKLKHLF